MSFRALSSLSCVAVAWVPLLLGSCNVFGSPKDASGASGKARMVMTWVPPYAVAKARARLDETYDGIGMKDALTDLSLQFWQPKPDGNGIDRVQLGDDTTDASIQSIRDWGHAHGVRVHLCIY